MSTAYGKIPKPKAGALLSAVLPLSKTLRDGSKAQLIAVDPSVDGLVKHLHGLFNVEIERGFSYPQEELLSEAQFREYFLGYDAFVLLKDGEGDNWEDRVLGMYYIKPNYPGRCSHICNAGFVTSEKHRGLGAGVAMAETFMILAPHLGYKASVFNLVFANNVASIRIWEKLGFQRAGIIPKAARLKNSPDKLVDAYIYYYDFEQAQIPNGNHSQE